MGCQARRNLKNVLHVEETSVKDDKLRDSDGVMFWTEQSHGDRDQEK
jgi:hypothetical protein